MRPPGEDLEGAPTILQEPYLNSTLGFASKLRAIGLQMGIIPSFSPFLCWVRAASGPFFGELFICT